MASLRSNMALGSRTKNMQRVHVDPRQSSARTSHQARRWGALPRRLYMHVRGHGDPVKFALHSALTESKTPFQPAASGAPQPAAPQIDLNTTALDETLGAKSVSLAFVFMNFAR